MNTVKAVCPKKVAKDEIAFFSAGPLPQSPTTVPAGTPQANAEYKRGRSSERFHVGGSTSSTHAVPLAIRRPEEPDGTPQETDSFNSSGCRRAHRPSRINQSRGKTERRRVATGPLKQEEERFLDKVLHKHFLFSNLEDSQRLEVIKHMQQVKATAAETIFSQGDDGDSIYVIQSGVFMVSIDDLPVKQLMPKQSFGELAMIYKVKRTATVTCKLDGILWKMDNECFRYCMERLSSKHLKRAMTFFESDPTFKHLTEEQKSRFAGVCSELMFRPGQEILREGEVGDWMFIVTSGTIHTTDKHGNSAIKKAGTLLGCVGYLYDRHQGIRAKALDKVTCLSFGRDSLERLLGPIESLLTKGSVKGLLLDDIQVSDDLNFFTKLPDEQQSLLMDQFEEATFSAGDVIIGPSSAAQLLVVVEGEVAALSKTIDEELMKSRNIERLRNEAVKVITKGRVHGAAEILEDVNLQEILVALGSVRLHYVTSESVSRVLNGKLHEVVRLNEIKRVLGDIFLFRNLPPDQLEKVIRSLVQHQYEAGEVIVKQGEEAKHFFLVQSGIVDVIKDGEHLRSLLRWDYFGERGLLHEEQRSASCAAAERTICLSLDKALFIDTVGSLRKDLEHRMMLQDLDIQKEDLVIKAIVGRGAFGVVKLVYHKIDETTFYALKCVSKKQVLEQNQQMLIATEREINSECYHPCIMHFIKTFQDSRNVYFLTEFLGGGDLFLAIREIGTLSKEQSMFYGASIVLALEYLHARNIMYRDLKPENVLLEFQGKAKLVDLGCCKKALRTNSVVGTPEYFAPEILIGKGYTASVDWWALGVIMHEMIVGPLPFGAESEDRLDLIREILVAPLLFPKYITDETAKSLLSGLLERTSELRLGGGSRGSKEIQEHSYFLGFNWDALATGTHPAPWIPQASRLQEQWDYEDMDLGAIDLSESHCPSVDVWCEKF